MYDSCFMKFVINAEIHWNSSTYNWEHGERETKKKNEDSAYTLKNLAGTQYESVFYIWELNNSMRGYINTIFIKLDKVIKEKSSTNK